MKKQPDVTLPRLEPETRYRTGPAHLVGALLNGDECSNPFDAKLADAIVSGFSPGKIVGASPVKFLANLQFRGILFSGDCVLYRVEERY